MRRHVRELDRRVGELERAFAPGCDVCGGPHGKRIVLAGPNDHPEQFCSACGRETLVVELAFDPSYPDE